jgi:hypothetical protein
MSKVWKTQIAQEYAKESQDKFEAILRITANNRAKITEIFREFARGLGLASGSDDGASVVLTWLLGTSKHSSRFPLGAALITQAVTGF